MKITRRSALKAAGIAGLTLLVPRKSRADVFGVFPGAQASLALPAAKRVKNVLEVYLYGGLSPWETLYFVDSYGKQDNTFYWAFEDPRHTGVDSNQLAYELCGSNGFEVSDFAVDGHGTAVQLGPYAFALRDRPDFVDRMRLVVQSHDLLPHEAAVPLAISGKRVGTPALAGLGAHIQRFYSENDPAAATRKSPYAYVLASSGAIPSDNTAALVATGTHPGSARPLRINVDAIEVLKQLMARDGLNGVVDRHDSLVELYTQKYAQRLKHPARADALRAPRFKEIAEAARAAKNASAVRSFLEPVLLAPPTSDVCGSGPNANVPQRSLEIAAHLLLDQNEPAKYVCVVDTGLTTASGGGGYDTHSDNCVVTARNFTNLMRGLDSVINKPGEHDPAKLDLDDTLVILNTEFGRTPTVQDGAGGRNHFPAGYVTAWLGGPVPGRTIAGALDDTGGARSFASPGENRIAALLALGIFPFSQDGFNISDTVDVATEPDAIARITSTILGVQS